MCNAAFSTRKQLESMCFRSALFALLLCTPTSALVVLPQRIQLSRQQPLFQSSFTWDGDSWSNSGDTAKRRFKRKTIPESEKEARKLWIQRQKEYERIISNSDGRPSIWSFESLFPEPIWDIETVDRDLYEVQRRDQDKEKKRKVDERQQTSKGRGTSYSGNSFARIWKESKLSNTYLARDALTIQTGSQTTVSNNTISTAGAVAAALTWTNSSSYNRIDRSMTRMVEDSLYGFRRTPYGDIQYATSLMGDGAVKFREGVRLGNPLSINADRLNYLAKKDLQKGRVEEAKELYERAIQIDPRDGRAYLGLSKCAERRRDFKLARECLQIGLANSVSMLNEMTPDKGANPFLLQALGCLEEKAGHLSEAEALYLAAVKSRPSHAAGWVALAQLRTRKLCQNAGAGRLCFQAAERELKNAGLPASSHVYTAWADLEYKLANDARRSRQLLKLALEIDPKCSAAWLQLGVLEADCKNWEEAQKCFDTVLKFDQRNTRILQAYALMESKRPDGNSRKAIGLFEQALAANPRDAGVLQAYGLYVASLGNVEAGRGLLRRGTEIDKRHAPVWQALGVLETRHGKPEEARRVFQEGIWSCAQLTGGHSGGPHCARLWQAWGVLESQEGNYAAARRCFSRALDADIRNVPTITAWALMEEKLGNIADARAIYERALPRFVPGSDYKMSLWRTYELMETRMGDSAAAQRVYLRSMREAIGIKDDVVDESKNTPLTTSEENTSQEKVSRKNQEVEVVRWDGGGGEIWLNDRAIEAKLPYALTTRQAKSKK